MTDIALLQNDNNAKTSIEEFFDSIKKIMRLKDKLSKQKERPKIGYEEEKENQHAVLTSGPSPMRSKLGLGEDIDDYFVFIYDEEEKSQQQKFKRSGGIGAGSTRILGFWCFNPGIGFREIQELLPRSIILTSGTLAPMDSFSAELQVEFKHQLENPHVISPNQVSISVVPKGPSGQRLEFSYNTLRNSKKEILLAAGQTLIQICKHTPSGILVFFPSYRLMEDALYEWDSTGIQT